MATYTTRESLVELRFRIPFRSYLIGPEDHCPLLTIKDKHYTATIAFEPTGIPMSFEHDGKTVWSKSVNELHFEVITSALDHPDIAASGDERLLPIYRFVRDVVNSVFRGIRNFGYVPTVTELPPQQEADFEMHLWRWAVELRKDDGTWEKVIDSSNLLVSMPTWLARAIVEPNLPMISEQFLPTIQEAIQNRTKPKPEVEFLNNAREAQLKGNLRWALLEAMTALEIKTAEYLDTYLIRVKRLSKTMVRKHLNPQITLSFRTMVLLRLCLPPKVVDTLRLDEVEKAINWRNEVVHKSGRLPTNLKDPEVTQGIDAIINLSLVLATQTETLEFLGEILAHQQDD